MNLPRIGDLQVFWEVRQGLHKWKSIASPKKKPWGIIPVAQLDYSP